MFKRLFGYAKNRIKTKSLSQNNLTVEDIKVFDELRQKPLGGQIKKTIISQMPNVQCPIIGNIKIQKNILNLIQI